MRLPIYLLCWLVSGYASAQLQDDFSDGDFTANPPWIGQTSKFQVLNEALQLVNAPASDEAYLLTKALTRDSTRWRFRIQLDFAPSANNRSRFYLSSNRFDLSGSLEGYFVQIGETGAQDGVDLYRQDGMATTKIIDGQPATVANEPDVWVVVERDSKGMWRLWIDSAGTGTLQGQGQSLDTTYPMGQAIGVWCKHTSSNNTAFTFDDISVGPLFVDTIPPEIEAVSVVDSQTLIVSFNEVLDGGTALNPANYLLNVGIGRPSGVQLLSPDSSQVQLSFVQALSSPGQYQLLVLNMADGNQNIRFRDSLTFTYYVPVQGDVRINELMPDPSPPQGWPEAEFVELYNRLPIPINLSGWILSDASTTAPLPPVELLPGGYCVLVDQRNLSQFPANLPLVAVDPLPTLNNSGDLISLTTPTGGLMDQLAYTDDWYADPNKEAGGWSLERLDPDSDCPGKTNWRASLDPTGATPGATNSWVGRFTDTSAPQLISAAITDTHKIVVTFSEAVDTGSITLSQISLWPQIGSPAEVHWLGAGQEQAELLFPMPLDTGELYQLQMVGIADCRGNILTLPIEATLLIPIPLEPGDLVVNEILFNPTSGGVDYVEVYNRSTKYTSLQGLLLEELDANGSVVDVVRVNEDILLPPDGFAALTTESEVVLLGYFTPNPLGVIAVADLPNFPDSEGGVKLVSKEGQLIDSMTYHEDWHFGLLDDVNGVALERIDPDAPSTQAQNWFSASSTVGYGTPAYRNSQFRQVQPFEGVIQIEPETVSPDGDGYQDQLSIAYQFTGTGFAGTVQVMDSRGRLIRSLLRSGLLEQSGTLLWDGLSDEGRKVDPGIYVVYIEVFNLQGQVKRFKHRCVVAERW